MPSEVEFALPVGGWGIFCPDTEAPVVRRFGSQVQVIHDQLIGNIVCFPLLPINNADKTADGLQTYRERCVEIVMWGGSFHSFRITT